MTSSTGRLLSSGLVALVVACGVVYGGDFFGIRERLQPLPLAPTPLAHGVAPVGGQPVLASTPYWRAVATLQGDAATTSHTVTIASGALQWRAQWTCAQGGRLVVIDSASGSKPLIDAGCAGSGTAFASRTGTVTLDVTAGGSWTLTVEQQVDVPIDDPPLPTMTAAGATVVSSGSFYGVDQQGSGTVRVYRVAADTYAIRLENFYVTPNAELDIRFSTPAAPHSDSDVANAPVAHVADLVATAGSMNFAVPPGIDPSHFGSVTIWCVQLQTAYSAATLVTSS